jgi:tRNA(Arg) A34 adenosine deaminase TadA
MDGPITDQDKQFMQIAIDASLNSIKTGGGPFGAVITKDGKIIAEAANCVVPNNDPTCHAEVHCIRKACTALGTHVLKGCNIYTSCEPCPMCLGAIYWARIDKIFMANTREDAKNIDFDDSFIYDEIKKEDLKTRTIPVITMKDTNAIEAFKEWKRNTEKVHY